MADPLRRAMKRRRDSSDDEDFRPRGRGARSAVDDAQVFLEDQYIADAMPDVGETPLGERPHRVGSPPRRPRPVYHPYVEYRHPGPSTGDYLRGRMTFLRRRAREREHLPPPRRRTFFELAMERVATQINRYGLHTVTRAMLDQTPLAFARSIQRRINRERRV